MIQAIHAGWPAGAAAGTGPGAAMAHGPGAPGKGPGTARPSPGAEPSIGDAARGFEAVFIRFLVDAMDRTAGRGLLHGGQGEEVFRGLLNEEYARAITERGGIGIAQAVVREIEGTE